jgi:hypothetical protein
VSKTTAAAAATTTNNSLFLKFYYLTKYWYILLIALSFRSLRLVDIRDIQLRPDALELALFQNVVMRHIEIAKETLLKK